jgi:hypothetical protein
MEGNTMGRMAMVEPGNAPAPLGRDRVELYAYMVMCSGAGVLVTLVGSGMVFAIDDRLSLAHLGAGSAILFQALLKMLDPGEEPTDADLDKMDAISKELNAFTAAFDERATGIRATN